MARRDEKRMGNRAVKCTGRLQPIVLPRQSPTLHGRFYRSRLYPLLRRVNTYLARWARKKYKRIRGYKRFKTWWSGILEREPGLFSHWAWVRQF